MKKTIMSLYHVQKLKQKSWFCIKYNKKQIKPMLIYWFCYKYNEKQIKQIKPMF